MASVDRLLASAIMLMLSAYAAQASAQRSQEAWTLVEELRIGSYDGAEILTFVTDLTVGDPGRIYVLQPMDGQIRVFDPGGSELEPLGREGSGPGEFRAPVRAGWVNDTLWVYDHVLSRVTLWHDGVLAGTFRYEASELGANVDMSGLMAVLEDGALLVDAAPRGEPPDPERPERLVYRVERDGSGPVRVTSRRFRAATPMAPRRGVRLMTSYQPFDDGTLIDIAPDGGLIVAVERDVAGSGRRTSFPVRAFTAAGDTAFKRWIEYDSIRLTEEVVDRVVEVPGTLVRRFASAAAAREAVLASIFVPDYQPPVSDLVVGRDHTVWLRREDDGSGSVTWMTLDDRGALIRTVEAPAGAEILAAEQDRVWALERDELDVPYVVRYRVERVGG